MIVDTVSMVTGLQEDFDRFVVGPQGLRCEWPNAPFEAAPADETYLSCHVLTSSNDEQLDVGAAVKTYRKFGVLHVGVYVRPQKGEREGLRIADLIASRYRSVERAGCVFDAPTIQSGTLTGAWWRIPVQCPFEAQYSA